LKTHTNFNHFTSILRTKESTIYFHGKNRASQDTRIAHSCASIQSIE